MISIKHTTSVRVKKDIAIKITHSTDTTNRLKTNYFAGRTWWIRFEVNYIA